MALPLYLAMTAAEIRENTGLPPRLAYMACHFSPYGTGLSNIPRSLPPGSMLILNDRTPIRGHDHGLIREQLKEIIERIQCSSLLLDFQNPNCEETAALAAILVESLSCPVGVSEQYAKELSCPVFVPPVPLDVPLAEYLQPYQGREIWLEAAMDAALLTLTAYGCHASPLPYPALTDGFQEDRLHCHYQISINDDWADFTLFRTSEDLQALLAEAEQRGVTQAVGLWQELNWQESFHPTPRLSNSVRHDKIAPSNMFEF